MPSKRALRLFFGVVVLLCAGVVVGSLLGQGAGSTGNLAPEMEKPLDDRREVVPDRNATTAFTSAPRGMTGGALTVYDDEGRTRYYNDTLGHYFDVDPVPGTENTVEYVAGEELSVTECPATTRRGCARIVVERANLTTGETERILTRYSRGAVWHDVDRIDEDHLLVGDIGRDRAFVIDTETEIVEWEWDAQSSVPMSEGGVFPADWTHLNDVEVLPDGRYMVSLRNQDQVVFVDPETGMQENWTLGADGDHGTLYEQHNPDYIPEERGGPAVLVADSENHRVVEYQRVDGAWEQSWEWSGPDLRWPRDADRLPNGHTLITDSNGNRVIEVDREGEIVWSTDVDTPYEADRFVPGEAVEGGESASRLELPSQTAGEAAKGPSLLERIETFLRGLYPSLVLNALLFASPPWVGPIEVTAVLVFVLSVLAWTAFELRWSGWGISVEIRRPD